MFRRAVVVAIAGLLLADPILCRAEAAAGPCAAACPSAHAPADDHRAPADPGPDPAHGCICQGATRGAVVEVPAATAAPWVALPVAADPLNLPSRRSGRSRPAPVPSHGPPDGRATRTARQSFQF